MSSLNDLINTIRRNRELKVTVGDYVFTCRRPTDSEIDRYRNEPFYSDTLAQNHVVAWTRQDGAPFVENDFCGGGGTSPVEFSPALWREWCADHMEAWEPIATALTNAYKEHRESLRQAEKNS